MLSTIPEKGKIGHYVPFHTTSMYRVIVYKLSFSWCEHFYSVYCVSLSSRPPHDYIEYNRKCNFILNIA
jgi:hypothetical protein